MEISEVTRDKNVVVREYIFDTNDVKRLENKTVDELNRKKYQIEGFRPGRVPKEAYKLRLRDDFYNIYVLDEAIEEVDAKLDEEKPNLVIPPSRIPNWIGPAGCTVEQARFVPIGADKLPDAMSAWERYLHSDAPDRLVQVAILHAEFEALHPFLDGNGRLGRMLVPLFLWQNGVIQRPMFYVSAFLEAHRDEYYERLLAVSRDGDWTGWCHFFLTAIKAQAEENQRKAADILALYERMKRELADLTRSQYAIRALDWIFERPIFKSSDFVASAGIPEPTAKRMVPALRAAGVLRVLVEASGRRAATLCFPELLNIAEGREAF
jgi:hypothetical protein